MAEAKLIKLAQVFGEYSVAFTIICGYKKGYTDNIAIKELCETMRTKEK